MLQTHAQLEQMLDALDESVPRLLQNKPAPGDFWASFLSMAQTIQQRAEPGEHGWVCDRLDAIQVKHHLVPPADQI
ncbi:hypothetical protein [Dyella japonica]|uniref:Uncharacterized protein n=1 Tax=Dyella japonica A8 TaxID=1217721 RepID=A0A075K2R8_9GAMM|nr:hypothetical protein [Dyella japonica]AIF48265.1 hypothetical protein HY57_13925 [Dyella japonica A8]